MAWCGGLRDRSVQLGNLNPAPLLHELPLGGQDKKNQQNTLFTYLEVLLRVGWAGECVGAGVTQAGVEMTEARVGVMQGSERPKKRKR